MKNIVKNDQKLGKKLTEGCKKSSRLMNNHKKLRKQDKIMIKVVQNYQKLYKNG